MESREELGQVRSNYERAARRDQKNEPSVLHERLTLSTTAPTFRAAQLPRERLGVVRLAFTLNARAHGTCAFAQGYDQCVTPASPV